MFEHQTQLELSEKDLCSVITIGLRDSRSPIRITGDVHVVAVRRGSTMSRCTIEIAKCPALRADPLVFLG